MPTVSRRSLLKAGVSTGVLATGMPIAASATEPMTSRLRALEVQHGARLGVYARNVGTGRTVRYRAGERFPMCSVFKGLAVGHVLRDYCGGFLDRVVHYTSADLVDFSPITSEHVATGMSVRDLCAAALEYSDNTAANLILRLTGGPHGVTRFCRSIGDPYTRLDRPEPDVNTAIPGDVRDTTTPAAIGHTYARLLFGRALAAPDRRQLGAWMKANTTSAEQFHAGLPADWVIADKTGSGDYGCTNDVGVAWTPDGSPLVLAVLSVKHTADAAIDYPLIAATARLLASTLIRS